MYYIFRSIYSLVKVHPGLSLVYDFSIENVSKFIHKLVKLKKLLEQKNFRENYRVFILMEFFGIQSLMAIVFPRVLVKCNLCYKWTVRVSPMQESFWFTNKMWEKFIQFEKTRFAHFWVAWRMLHVCCLWLCSNAKKLPKGVKFTAAC